MADPRGDSPRRQASGTRGRDIVSYYMSLPSAILIPIHLQDPAPLAGADLRAAGTTCHPYVGFDAKCGRADPVGCPGSACTSIADSSSAATRPTPGDDRPLLPDSVLLYNLVVRPPQGLMADPSISLHCWTVLFMLNIAAVSWKACDTFGVPFRVRIDADQLPREGSRHACMAYAGRVSVMDQERTGARRASGDG